ncbi:hypothetical protein [Streptomyces sp. SD15]
MRPEIAIAWADSAYGRNQLVPWVMKYVEITMETSAARQHERLHRAAWVVERSWSWVMRASRHRLDHERLAEMSEFLTTWAAITLMSRRLTRREAAPSIRRDVTPHYPQQQAA